jgi:hypothetical protein
LIHKRGIQAGKRVAAVFIEPLVEFATKYTYAKRSLSIIKNGWVE